MDGLASRVDHVVIETGNEDELFSFLHERMGLPVAWPLARWAGLHEGGIGAGNCNIGCNHLINPGRDVTPALTLIALQPAGTVDAVLAELSSRSLAPSEPMTANALDLPETGAFDPWRRGWTTIMVWGGPDLPMPLFCDYDHDMDERAACELANFEAEEGGPFGITALRAVEVSTPDVPRATRAWTVVLGENAVVGEDVLALPGSPELRFRVGAPSTGLLFGVRSLDQAASAAADRYLSYETGRQVRLDPADTLGLNIAFE